MHPAWLAVALPVVAALGLNFIQESQDLLPQEEQRVFVQLLTDPVKAEKLVLESSVLDPWSLTYVSDYCAGTSKGAPRIRCEWDNVDAGSEPWVDFGLKYGDYVANGTTMVYFALTSYAEDADSGEIAQVGATSIMIEWQPGSRALLQADESKFGQPRTITVSALPDTNVERRRLKQANAWADFQPTGFYLNPRQSLVAKVSGVSGDGPQPEILVGTPALVDPESPDQEVASQLESLGLLGNGNHDVSAEEGGIVYIRYVYAGDTRPPPVTVTLEGAAAQPFPLFRQGVTTDEEWLAMLRETKVPFAEHAGDAVIITGMAVEALKYAERGQSQQELLDTYKHIIAAQDAISGLDVKAHDARDRPSPLRPMVVQSNKKRYADASDYRAAIGTDTIEDIWWRPTLAQSWKMWHELGHHRQHTETWSWRNLTEVTVNIYTLAARRLFPEASTEHATVEEWDAAKAYLAGDAGDKVFEQQPVFTMLVMFEQLRVVFGDKFYHKLHRRSRAAPDLDDEADKKHFFMTQAAEIAHTNLTPYFTSWGLLPEKRTVDEMGKQPSAVEDYTAKPVFGGH
ncbi:hypothetical protein G6O67_003608 [Ophiocordyceps sinensis]|uniref:Peptidase M60 domain-containing protein n=2 Tax=Ophiocordyceps sinensis TaxID=72228 RepID=A0A8H4V663_9HYPO|nr:hypothetical protein G6O67_003608 [Ophiocordyceps sinensis]